MVLLGSGVWAASPDSVPPARWCGVVHGPPSALRLAGAAEVSPLGVRKLLILRVRFTDDRAVPVAPEEIAADAAEADETFRRISRGRFGLAVTISSLLELGRPRSHYATVGGFDGLIDDARAAGVAAGVDFQEFDLEIVRHSGVAGFAGGNARLGMRGAQVQIAGGGIIVHELGHNLGLNHANFWDTSGPGVALASPPLPSNFHQFPDPRSIPLHPDSVIGQDTVTGPGQSLEYGDGRDIMGGGARDFSAVRKRWLGWLDGSAEIQPGEGRSFFRLHAVTNGADRLLTARLPLPPNDARIPYDLALEFDTTVDRQGATRSGLLLRWVPRGAPWDFTQVLDGQPGLSRATGDRVLPLGRTWVDRAADVAVTLVAAGSDADGAWGDVVLQRGLPSSNQPPVVSLVASRGQVELGEEVVFTASGTDADGDPLSWFWTWGDGTSSGGPEELRRSWNLSGDRVVQVEGSDGRGGIARAQVVVRVGTTKERRIVGRVVDQEGRPVPGVRVHNGRGDGGRPDTGLVETLTDQQGTYLLTGLGDEPQAVQAFHPRYLAQRRPPVVVAGEDLSGVDLVLHELPWVSVSLPAAVAESAGVATVATFTRSGATDRPLTVLYRLGGTASAPGDYARPLVEQVTFAAGQRTVALDLGLVNDTAQEGDETLEVAVVHPVRFPRQAEDGETFEVYFPGLELVSEEGHLSWTRTRPDYVPGDRPWGRLRIEDDDTQGGPVVSVSATDLLALEEPVVDGAVVVSRETAGPEPLRVGLEFGGTAVAGTDYEAPPQSVEIPAGESSLLLTLRPLPDGVEEPEETIVVRVVPGDYAVGVGEAIVRLRDRVVFPQRLELARRPDGQWEVAMEAAPGAALVLEASTVLGDWIPLWTNRLFNTSRATVIVPALPGSRYFRTVRLP